MQRLASALERHNELAPDHARLEDLERSRTLWEADIQALLVKAESTLSGARNAESRARTMLKHYEKDSDPFPDDREEVIQAVPASDVIASEEEGLQPVHVGVAPDYKTIALAQKFA